MPICSVSELISHYGSASSFFLVSFWKGRGLHTNYILRGGECLCWWWICLKVQLFVLPFHRERRLLFIKSSWHNSKEDNESEYDLLIPVISVYLSAFPEASCFLFCWNEKLFLSSLYQHDIRISSVSIVIWSNLKQISSLYLKRFLYSYTFTDSFMSRGLYLPFPKHKTGKKEILHRHIFPLMKLASFRNDSKRVCVRIYMYV